MSKQYNNEEISRILCQDLIFSRTINDRLDETYALIRANARQIREGGAENSHRRVRKMGRRKICRRLGLAAAVMVLLAAASLAVVAAGGFFVKNSSQTGDSMTSVSYTHLDVYKRQLITCSIKIKRLSRDDPELKKVWIS